MKKNYNQPEMQVMAMTPSYMVMAAGSNLNISSDPINDEGGD